MSKIWVNGKEIDLALLTPEQLSALTESYNHDFIQPTGLYYDESISGDGSFDNRYGVAKLNHSLEIDTVDDKGKVSKQTYDGSSNIVMKVDTFRSIADQNTIEGAGTEASPLKVSDNLLKSIDSAYTMAIQTAVIIDDLESTVEDVIDLSMEISGKCDSAVSIANSALTVAYIASATAENAVAQVEENKEAIDKLYDFVSTLIYTIEYNCDTNSLDITYVDGTTGSVEIKDITVLEEAVVGLTDYADFLSGRIDQIELDMKQVVTDVTYDKETSTLTIHYFDGSTKDIALEDLTEVKNKVNDLSLAVADNTEAINNLTNNFNVYSAKTDATIDTIENSIDDINNDLNILTDYTKDIYEMASANSGSIEYVSGQVKPVIARFPSAVQKVDYSDDAESGNVITITDFDGNETIVPLSGINEALKEGVKDVTYDDATHKVTVSYLDPDKEDNIFTIRYMVSKTTKLTFGLTGDEATLNVNGDDVTIKKQDPTIDVEGNSVTLSDASGISSLELNGMILGSDSELDGNTEITAITNFMFPADGHDMFSGDTNLVSINKADSDLLINGENMFNGCSKLETFEGNTHTLIIATNMFRECTSLTEFSTDMPMLTEANYMFYNCESLNLLGDLNFKRLEEAEGMFADCDNLTSVEGIKLDKLKNGTKMFSGSSKMNTSSISTPSLISGESMYEGTSFETYESSLSNLVIGTNMFANNTVLNSVDLTTTSKLKNANGMFSGCSSLQTAIIDMTSAIRAENMFDGCTALTELELQNLNCDIDLSDTNISSATALDIASNVVSQSTDTGKIVRIITLKADIVTSAVEKAFANKNWTIKTV